jgi:ribosome-binding protein aMBF1 (putative translation factor)
MTKDELKRAVSAASADFVTALEGAMEAKGMNEGELAARVKWKRSIIDDILNGTIPPTLAQAVELLHAVGEEIYIMTATEYQAARSSAHAKGMEDALAGKTP